MKKEITVVFDIGKTNKKVFIFDKDFNEIDREYIRFDEILDDDGFLGEDLTKVVHWMTTTFDKILADDRYHVKSLNFSTYGASLVHLNDKNEVVVPFYNYLKPFPKDLEEHLFKDLDRETFELEIASPFLGMLNSGMQLYYLKYKKPEQFKQIHRSIHLPQYLSSIFTGKYITDFTSLGCHTALWDFKRNQYASWVQREGFESLFAPIVASNDITTISHKGHEFIVGTGVHDSSSAIIPYINATDNPFILISTGTWSICMNFFNEKSLTVKELSCDCLNFLSLKGSSVKASRLFLGKHMSNRAEKLCEYFKVEYQSYKTLEWPKHFVSKRKAKNQLLFDHSLLSPERFGYTNNDKPDYSIFDSYEDAMLHFMDELTDLQIDSLLLAKGSSDIKTVYIDGGFSASKVFLQFLANKLPAFDIYSTSFSLGTALGAALLVNYRSLPDDFLSNNYQVRKHEPYNI